MQESSTGQGVRGLSMLGTTSRRSSTTSFLCTARWNVPPPPPTSRLSTGSCFVWWNRSVRRSTDCFVALAGWIPTDAFRWGKIVQNNLNVNYKQLCFPHVSCRHGSTSIVWGCPWCHSLTKLQRIISTRQRSPSSTWKGQEIKRWWRVARISFSIGWNFTWIHLQTRD